MALVKHIRRSGLRRFLDRLTVNPEHIFSVVCERRTPLYLRYEPANNLATGKLAYAGDCSNLRTHRLRRTTTTKIILQEAGTLRTMIAKRKTDAKPMKHWRSKGGRLPFDPATKGLYLVTGMYNDSVKDMGTGARIGRHGAWRPWCLIDLNTTRHIKYDGVDYVVTGN